MVVLRTFSLLLVLGLSAQAWAAIEIDGSLLSVAAATTWRSGAEWVALAVSVPGPLDGLSPTPRVKVEES